MSDFKNINDIFSYRAHRIITKRIEPYDVIESVKKFYNIKDFTFNGRNKFEVMEDFLNSLKTSSKTSASIGLYMKNVNKFYLAVIKNNPDNLSDTELLHKLLIEKEYGFTPDEEINSLGITYSTDTAYSLEQIDMGKAEAVFILV